MDETGSTPPTNSLSAQRYLRQYSLARLFHRIQRTTLQHTAKIRLLRMRAFTA